MLQPLTSRVQWFPDLLIGMNIFIFDMFGKITPDHSKCIVDPCSIISANLGMVKTLLPNDSFHDLLMRSTCKSKPVLSFPQLWFITLQMPVLVKRGFSKLHMIIWSRIKQTLNAKNTLSTNQPSTKPFMELVKEKCQLEILGGISVHRSLTGSLAGRTFNMTSFIPRPTLLALTVQQMGSHLQFACDVFPLASLKDDRK